MRRAREGPLLQCELVQWGDRGHCRRCGTVLPEPVVKIVERVVEKVIIPRCPQCGGNHDAAVSEGAAEFSVLPVTPDRAVTVVPSHFPTMAEVERIMILAAYRRSNRRPLEAARLLGIGKTTLYRKLRQMRQAAA